MFANLQLGIMAYLWSFVKPDFIILI